MAAVTLVATPLGSLSIRVAGRDAPLLQIGDLEAPPLPEGMRVDGVKLIAVILGEAVTERAPVSLSVTGEQSAWPDSGEWLDSVEFKHERGMVHVAMRDSDWLAAKGIRAEIAYERNGFRQTIYAAARGTTLYMSVAWRGGAIDPEDFSTWFGADLALPS